MYQIVLASIIILQRATGKWPLFIWVKIEIIFPLATGTISGVSSIEATPALPAEIGTITTTEADLEYEKFKMIKRTGEISDYDFRFKFEQTVHTIDPTITVEKIERSVTSYDKDDPFNPFMGEVGGSGREVEEGIEQLPWYLCTINTLFVLIIQ